MLSESLEVDLARCIEGRRFVIGCSVTRPELRSDRRRSAAVAIAAVELDAEKMVVLGQVVAGVGVADLKAAIAEVEATVARESGAPKSRQIRVTTSKAL